MRQSERFIFGTIIASLLLISRSGAQPDKEFWNDPQFVREFIGSFGVRSDIEPHMTENEQLLYRELAAIISTNQTMAIDRIRTVLAEGGTTVQPPPFPTPEGEKPSRRQKLPEPVDITIENQASFWFVLGNLQILEGKTDEAIASYGRAIASFPDFLRAHKNLGVLMVQNQRFDDALKPLLKAIELGGSDGDLYGLLGACYLSSGRNRSAELAYNQAMLLAPGKKDWQLGAARALLYQARYLEASSLFGELISQDATEPRYWLFQANCFVGLNEPLKAAFNYEVVRELGAADAATLSALGDIYLSRNLKDVATDTYLDALAIDPATNRDRAIRSAEILAGRRAVDQSEKLISAIREQAGSSLDENEKVRLLRLQSKLALARGEDAEAARIMETLLDNNPLDGEIMLLLAAHYGKSGEVERAETMFERASRIPEFEVDAHVKHAQLLVRLKVYDRAIEHLRRALAIEPKDTVQRYLDGVLKVREATNS